MTQTSKPVTPKTLFMMSTGLNSVSTPQQHRIEFTRKPRNKTQTNKLAKPDSPLPGFVKEYLVNEELRESKIDERSFKRLKSQMTQISQVTQMTQRVKTTQAQVRRRQRMWREEDLRKEEIVKESRVFRIYKPQVIEISPRSKFTIYSTIQLSNTSPLKRIQGGSLGTGQVLKSATGVSKGEETLAEVLESKDYLKPALTFGEKLWRLNEVSIFSMINK